MVMFKRVESSIQKRIGLIEGWVYSDSSPIKDFSFWETKDHVTVEEAAKKTFKPCKLGQQWGGPWSTAWFRARFAMPASMAGKSVIARFDLQGEGVAFIDDVPAVGISGTRNEVTLPRDARAGRKFEILIESGNNTGAGPLAERSRVAMAELTVVNQEVMQLFHDLRFLNGVMQNLDQSSPRYAEIRHILAKATNAIDFDAADREAEAARIRKMLRPLFGNRANASAVNMVLSGHAHIDVIWLWPLAETIRKCARTFSSVVRYMDRFPDFRFTATQAALYEFTRDRYPKLYGRVKQAVKRRQWEVSTGMYVESDTNVPSGESLVRQVMFGKGFARDEFGTDVDVLVLPDVFGYSAALPQILRKAGIDFFTTQKLSWNDSNPFPYNSFRWEGIDGSEVLSHFLPSGNYGLTNSPAELINTEKAYSEKDRSKLVLCQFGHGDGGGGPTIEMIENARRAKDFEGLPRCRMGFIRDFFHALRDEGADLPRWVGELYLEFHRGTLTTQARAKTLNRRCEVALRDTEFFGAVDAVTGGRYDHETINKCWKLVLLNQFHDVLPGSSIADVYKLAAEHHGEALLESTTLARESAASTARHIDTSGEGVPVVVWNSLSWERSASVQVTPPEGVRNAGVVGASGEPVPVQKVPGGDILFYADDVPAMGYEVYHIVPGAKCARRPTLKVTEKLLENEFLRVRINRHGELTSLYDKAGKREALHGGPGNELQLYHDQPFTNDAWEIDYHERKDRIKLPAPESIKVVERGPVRAAVEVRRRFGESTLTQRIVLWAGRAQVEFETEVDWRESHKALKVAFPVDVHATDATYEIQFGSVRRPTHMNTTWDSAKFEVCGHKWVDLSEPGYGVSLLNDCKYGYDVHGNTMRLTLLRAPKSPDPTADISRHTFRYAAMPHAGDHAEAETVRRGYEFNVPLRHTFPEAGARRGPKLPASCSFFEVDAPGVVLDTVKKAEDEDALILRLYEAHGGHVRTKLVSPLPMKSAVECDLLERKTLGRAMKPKACTFDLHFAPFEIKTLKMKLG